MKMWVLAFIILLAGFTNAQGKILLILIGQSFLMLLEGGGSSESDVKKELGKVKKYETSSSIFSSRNGRLKKSVG